MNVLSTEKRVQIVGAMVEGNSLRSITRMVGCSINTVSKLLVELGEACDRFHNYAIRGVACKRIQCDETWAFVYAKQKNLPDSMQNKKGVGSVWTWVGMCADSKLVLAYHVGTRDADCAAHFMEDLASRLSTRVQLTTDGHRAYLDAVDGAFGAEVDYSMLIKLYGNAQGEHRYSPGVCIGSRPQYVKGYPDPKHVSTSYVERQNLTMRMSMRRFTRLTNGFSKKVQNLEAAIAIHYCYYNLCRIHKTLRVTPAMEAGLAGKVWEIEDLLKLLDWEAPAAKSN